MIFVISLQRIIDSQHFVIMNAANKYIRFDWAVKRMLRDKANFAVLEGLVTVLLGQPIHIMEILESEGNQETDIDKYNRVDIKAKNQNGEIILVEVQLTRQLHYLERILYGVSKAITEHISLGQPYSEVKKVYSISIVYFDLGQGSDYLYHGTTSFVGVHTHDTLTISSKEQDTIKMKTPEEVFPEYFIIRINNFNDVAKTPIEEWIDYLKNGHIKDDTTTPGLSEAREKLLYMAMNDQDRRDYEHHMGAIVEQADVLNTAKLEGLAEGREKGLAEGREEGLAEGLAEGRAEGVASVARNLKAMGLSPEEVAKATGLSLDQLASL